MNLCMIWNVNKSKNGLDQSSYLKRIYRKVWITPENNSRQHNCSRKRLNVKSIILKRTAYSSAKGWRAANFSWLKGVILPVPSLLFFFIIHDWLPWFNVADWQCKQILIHNCCFSWMSVNRSANHVFSLTELLKILTLKMTMTKPYQQKSNWIVNKLHLVDLIVFMRTLWP